MCGIVGYIGKRQAQAIVLSGLRRLEYRGYDSAGFACIEETTGKLCWTKAAGPLSKLEERLVQDSFKGHIGMGHTRWATHGVPTEVNAHPHFNPDKTIAVIHNGIVENFAEQKKRLQALGYSFYSDTDTEVIACLFDELLKSGLDARTALFRLARTIEGAFACVLIAEQFPNELFLLRKRSPLCIGFGDGENFVASDPAAFCDQISQVLFMPDATCALVSATDVALFDFAGNPVSGTPQPFDLRWCDVAQGNFAHFMLKEMFEQKRVIQDTVSYCKNITDAEWKRSGFSIRSGYEPEQLHFVACGTSAHAAEIAACFFEDRCLIPTAVSLASEFRYQRFFPCIGDVYCFLSQSGETADTLEALRLVRAYGMHTTSIVNVPMSSMVRETDGVLFTQAQREVAVASTKSFTAQLALLFWIAHKVALEQGHISPEALAHAENELLVVAEVLEDTMRRYEAALETTIAKRYAAYEKFIFLGRSLSYPFAQEAALKLKEIAYLFVDCYPAGELKHGPIALVEPSVPVFIFSLLDDTVYPKLVSNAQEVKARSGHLVVFCCEGQDELIALADEVFIFPRVHPLLVPLAMTGVMQLFVYHVARVLGRPIDKPRNLAKSVTVE